MSASLSTSLSNFSRIWPGIRDRGQFNKEKKALCNIVYSAVNDRFSQETAMQALKDFDVSAFKEKLTHVKELGSRAHKVSKALSRIGFIDLERKESKWRNPYNLEVRKSLSDVIYNSLSKAKEEHIEKALEYLIAPLQCISLPTSSFILEGRATVQLPRSTFRFFENALRGVFPIHTKDVQTGTSGEVGHFTLNKAPFIYKKAKDNEEALTNVKIESLALMRFKHPHIVPVEAIDMQGMYLPVADGDLIDLLNLYINKKINIPREELKRWLESIAGAVSYVHELGMIYKDVKLDNILFIKVLEYTTPEGKVIPEHIEVFLCDFGFLVSSKDDKASRGSPSYAAPELLLGKEPYSQKVDSWSMGVLIFYMVAGKHPMYYSNPDQVGDEKKIMQEVKRRPNLPYKYVSPQMNELLLLSDFRLKFLGIATKCLHGDPDKRSSVKEIVEDLQKMSI